MKILEGYRKENPCVGTIYPGLNHSLSEIPSFYSDDRGRRSPIGSYIRGEGFPDSGLKLDRAVSSPIRVNMYRNLDDNLT